MKDKPMTADEVFVTLVSLGREDLKIGKFLRAVVDLDEFERKSLINTMISEMALKGAPAEFTKAIAALRDPQIIASMKDWLEQPRS